MTGGEAFLLASGFTIETTEGNEVYVLRPSAQAWPRLVAAGEEVTRKVAEINTQPNNFGTAAAPSMPAAVPPSNNAFGGMPGMGVHCSWQAGCGSAADIGYEADPGLYSNTLLLLLLLVLALVFYYYFYY